MLRLLRYFGLLLLVFLLAGCIVGEHGYIHNRRMDYLKSENLPKTRLPVGLQPASMEAAYVIPQGSGFSQRTAVSIIPPGNDNDLITSEAKAPLLKPKQLTLGQGSNGFLTLKVPTDYSTAWQKITNLLPKQGYQVMGSDRKTGVIEVMAPTSHSNENHIYQFSILQGKQSTFVSLLDQSGNPVDDKISKRLLTQLKNGLGKQNEKD